MKILKVIVAIVFLLITFVFTVATNYYHTNDSIDVSKYDKITEIVVDIENTDLQLSSSNTNQILIDQNVPNIQKDKVNYNISIDQNVLKITRPVDESIDLNFQSKLEIIIPDTMKLSNINVISKNCDISLAYLSSDNINFSGFDSNVKLDGVNAKVGISTYDMSNFNMKNSIFENFKLDVSSGSLQLSNSRINKMLETNIAHGSTSFDSSYVFDSKIGGKQLIYLTLSQLYNAEIHTTRKMSGKNLTVTDYGYEYVSPQETKEVIKINAGNLKIK